MILKFPKMRDSVRFAPLITPQQMMGRHLPRFQGNTYGNHFHIITAPAGSGKSFLLTHWYNQLKNSGNAVVWHAPRLSQQTHADFASSLLAAIEYHLFNLYQIGKPDFAWRTDSTDSAEILFALEKFRKPVTLFLDDYDLIEDAENNELLLQLLFSRNVMVQIVLGCRRQLDLNLHRLRVENRVTELGWQDLWFDEKTIGEFFRQIHNTELDDDSARLLWYKTLGWPAAVQLAALQVKNNVPQTAEIVERFSGATHEVKGYFDNNIFNALAPAVQQFCLFSSALHSLHPQLCDTLLSIAESAHIIVQLESQALLNRDAENSGWHHFHPLFAEYLREQGQWLYGQRIAELKETAAEWCIDNELFVDAVHYFLSNGDYLKAAEYIVKCDRTLVRRGKMPELQALVEQFPERMIQQNDPLAVINGWLSFHFWDWRNCSRLLKRIEEKYPNKSDIGEVLPEAYVLRAGMNICEQNYAELQNYNENKLEKLSASDPFLAGTFGNILAAGYLAQGLYDKTYQVASQSLQWHRADGSPYGTIISRALRTVCDIEMGRYSAAEVELQLAEKAGRVDTSSYCQAYAKLLRGILDYRCGRQDAARALLERYLPELRHCGCFEIQRRASATLASLYALQGKVTRAINIIESYMGEPAFMESAIGLSALIVEKARVFLLAGDLPNARRLFQLLDPATLAGNTQLHKTYLLAAIRFELEQGNPAVVEPYCRLLHEQALTSWEKLQTYLSEVIAAMALADDASARIALHQAFINTTSQNGVLFLELGPAAFAVVRRYGGEVIEHLPREHREEAKLLSEWLKEHQFSKGIEEADGSDRHPAADTSGIAFTDRERAILRLISDGSSNQAIASELNLSINTIKWHTRNILQKLDAKSRTQAVALARKLGFLQ